MNGVLSYDDQSSLSLVQNVVAFASKRCDSRKELPDCTSTTLFTRFDILAGVAVLLSRVEKHVLGIGPLDRHAFMSLASDSNLYRRVWLGRAGRGEISHQRHVCSLFSYSSFAVVRDTGSCGIRYDGLARMQQCAWHIPSCRSKI